MPKAYVDSSDAYANHHKYYIEFVHIPTDRSVKFKAFLTDYDDQYASSWRDEDVYGRMDPISTFQGTTRQLSFSFDVVAGSKEEGEQNYLNSKTLISFLYPVYERIAGSSNFSATSIQAPPLLKIRFANLISEEYFGSNVVKGSLVGKLNGLSYRPDFDIGFFDDTFDRAIPRVNRFSCNYTVFHTQNLGFDSNNQTALERSRAEAAINRRLEEIEAMADPDDVAAMQREVDEEFMLEATQFRYEGAHGVILGPGPSLDPVEPPESRYDPETSTFRRGVDDFEIV